MKYFKLILFILIASTFVFTIYTIYIDRNTNSVGNVAGGAILFIALIIALITGIITLIVLFKSPIHYFYIFLGIISIPVLLIILDGISVLKKEYEINQYLNWSYELETQEASIWKNINNTVLVEKILETTQPSTQDNYKEYKTFKATVYYGLSEYDKQYSAIYQQFAKENNLDKCKVFERLLKFKQLKNETDYIFVLKILDSPHKEIRYCIPYFQDSITKEDFYFKTLFSKGYKEAALLALDEEEINHPEYYINQFKEIKDVEYRKKALKILIKNADFSNYQLKDFFKLILAQSNEPDFETYLTFFSEKINTLDFKKTEFVNPENQAKFIKLYKLIGKNHPFIKALPQDFVATQLTYQIEIEGKPSIHFVQFFSQVFNLEHAHPINYQHYTIKHNNKIIYKGISNKYGCVSYKSYDLKPTDVIEINLDYFHYKTAIGWKQLLPNWKTEQGAQDRFNAMGYSSYTNMKKVYNNGNIDFNINMAKKIKKDFDYYFDKKWQD